GQTFVGVNVSDREDDWEQNYRIPDLAVFLRGTAARNCGTHWCGGPDFVGEILSPNDQTRDKLPFYQSLRVRAVLLIDRAPWPLEFYSLRRGCLRRTGRDDLDPPTVLASSVLPLTFHLVASDPRPLLQVTHQDATQQWLI